MITDEDVTKIKKALVPEFEKQTNKIKKQTNEMKKEIKKYIHEGIDATIDGIDNLLSEYDFQARITKLEKIHPQGRHHPID